jgi:hypothetical protein
MTSLKNFKDSRSTGLGDKEWNAFIELAKNGREGKAVIDAPHFSLTDRAQH